MNFPTITKRNHLGELMTSLNYSVAIEIGVNKGVFSKTILSKWDGTLYMCDLWRHIDGYVDIANTDNESFEKIYQEAKGNTKHFGDRAKIIRDCQ